MKPFGRFAKRVLGIFTGVSFWAAAATYAVSGTTIKHDQFSIDLPDGWTELDDVMGIPLLLVGPMVTGRRPSISVSPTGLNARDLSLDRLKSEEKNFQKEKEEFLAQANAKILKFFPYEKSKWAKDIEVHVLGVEYEAAGLQFLDRTYYISCKGKLFHLKSMMLLNHGAKISDQVANSVKSFRCK